MTKAPPINLVQLCAQPIKPLVASDFSRALDNTMRQNRGFSIFRLPVLEDPSYDEQIKSSYRSLIQHPVCVMEIKYKLSNGEYESLGGFLAEVRLVRDNCCLFNSALQDFVDLANLFWDTFCVKSQHVFAALGWSGVLPNNFGDWVVREYGAPKPASEQVDTQDVITYQNIALTQANNMANEEMVENPLVISQVKTESMEQEEMQLVSPKTEEIGPVAPSGPSLQELETRFNTALEKFKNLPNDNQDDISVALFSEFCKDFGRGPLQTERTEPDKYVLDFANEQVIIRFEALVDAAAL